ncbi:hypothetical protein [Aurantiacibacter sediminis]|uniref:Uncharacterized protein n=1 Tax=Aurantiacibacter sediminis TaxID=2793064 RepID=A0ABS0N417_9SPHN|nr:hypothetical protein [Aurantiacibacter sediminis]MBH5322714.1 hypothetical protein [Aurantiacibacter sediminis]
MRAALISLPHPGEAPQPSVAGKTLAQRQLLFARQCGCTQVVAHGGGASEDAIALRHAAEKAGMRYQVISNAHALPGAIKDADSLLIFQPGLLPESRQALELIQAEGDRMLVFSAGPGTAAGFERIDLDRAWGGVMTVPGKWLGQLTSLPEEAAPHAALLRIALQHCLSEARLDDSVLDDGKWQIIRDADAAKRHEAGWMQAHLGKGSLAAPSCWVGSAIAARAGGWLMQKGWAKPAVIALFGLLLTGSVAAAVYELPVLSFALAATSVPVVEFLLGITRLSVAPFGEVRRWPILRKAVDLAILVSGVLVIDSLWYRAAFPPFVLFATLLLLDRSAAPAISASLRDRALIAGALAILSAIVPPEVAFMLIATLVLAAKLLPVAQDSR